MEEDSSSSLRKTPRAVLPSLELFKLELQKTTSNRAPLYEAFAPSSQPRQQINALVIQYGEPLVVHIRGRCLAMG